MTVEVEYTERQRAVMVSFLFWNLGGAPLHQRVARIAAALDIDVLMLAECKTAFSEFFTVLNQPGRPPYYMPRGAANKVRILTRLPPRSMIEQFSDPLGGLTIRRLKLGPPPGILLAPVHLPSRVNWDRDDQTLHATRLADDLVRAEQKVGHSRTVLVGDLNMNPFDPGVAGALHAVSSRAVVRRGQREIKGRKFPLFYNPMWGASATVPKVRRAATIFTPPSR